MWQFQQVFPVSYKYFLGKLFSQAISVAIDYWITKGHTKVHYNSLARIMTYMSCFWIYHTIRETKGALNQVAWLQNSAPVYIWSLLLNTNTYLLIWKSFSFRQHLSILLKFCHVKMAGDCQMEIAHLGRDKYYSWECGINPVVVEGCVNRLLNCCHKLLWWGPWMLNWGQGVLSFIKWLLNDGHWGQWLFNWGHKMLRGPWILNWGYVVLSWRHWLHN